MYAMKPRSVYRKFPGQFSVQQPDVYSGYLVVTDEESEQLDASCWGICRSNKITSLPFPQDKILKIVHTAEYDEASVTNVWFVPVLDHPLSSNRYYVIKAADRHKGRAYTCSKEGDMGTCCFNNVRMDKKPRPFDHRDIYQQFEIRPSQNGGFYAKSVEWDGFPPKVLQREGWEVYISGRSFKLNLRELSYQGLFRTSQPRNLAEVYFPPSSKRSAPITLGKWFCPFIFIKEETKRKSQMKKSPFYLVTLDQYWEEIYSSENDHENDSGDVVAVDAVVKRLVTQVRGMEAEKDDRHGGDDGSVWFRVEQQDGRRACNVGLSSAVVEKMRRLQERRGWFDDRETCVRVESVQEVRSENGWRKFSCYVLAESFVFRRLDGSLLINFSFKNTNKIECKCE